MHLSRVGLAFAIAVALVLTGCGSAADDEDASTGSEPAGQTEAAAVPTATSEASEPVPVLTTTPEPQPDPTATAAPADDPEPTATPGDRTEPVETTEPVDATEPDPDTGNLTQARNDLGLMLTFLFDVDPDDTPSYVECIIEELQSEGLDPATVAADEDNAAMVAALRCDVPSDALFDPADLAFVPVPFSESEARCTVDTLVDYARGLPLAQANDLLADPNPPQPLLDRFNEECGLSTEQLAALADG